MVAKGCRTNYVTIVIVSTSGSTTFTIASDGKADIKSVYGDLLESISPLSPDTLRPP